MKVGNTGVRLHATQRVLHVALLLLIGAVFFTGCHYNLAYRLSETTIMQAAHQKQLSVAVLTLEDARDSVEKTKSAREDSGDPDPKDYTYDKQFGDKVALDISKMLVKHLEYSHAFKAIALVDQETPRSLPRSLQTVRDSLAGANVDAILTGKIGHFYGYYDQHVGKQILYGTGLALGIGIPVAIATTSTETKAYGFEETKTNPLAISLATTTGFMIGSWLESTGSRRIAWHTMLDLQLVSTSTGEILWEGTTEVSEDDVKAMPGLNTAKRSQEVAVNSLRLAVNDLVTTLSEAQIASE